METSWLELLEDDDDATCAACMGCGSPLLRRSPTDLPEEDD